MSHARITAVTSMIKNGAGKVPGLLAVLALVPDPRRPRGRRYPLAFILAIAAACTLAGAKTFREIGDQAADLPQNVLRDLGGKRHMLKRKIIAPSETRIRTLLHLIDTAILDDILGTWLRDLADQGKLDGLLTAIAVDGKWLRGVLDGQVKLFSAMLHEDKVIIAQHRIPDDTTETTQVKALLGPVDLDGAVVTADAVNAQDKTAEYIAGKEEDGGRESDYFLFVKGNRKHLQRAIFDAVQAGCPATPTGPSSTGATAGSSAAPSGSPTLRTSTSRTSGRWPGSAATATPPTAPGSARKSCTPPRASARTGPAPLTSRNSPAGNGVSNPCTGSAIPRGTKTRIPDTPETDPRPWPPCGISASACSIFPASPRSPAPSRPSDATETGSSTTYRYETQVSNDFGDPVVRDLPSRGTLWSHQLDHVVVVVVAGAAQPGFDGEGAPVLACDVFVGVCCVAQLPAGDGIKSGQLIVVRDK